jgi:hypothetical protein
VVPFLLLFLTSGKTSHKLSERIGVSLHFRLNQYRFTWRGINMKIRHTIQLALILILTTAPVWADDNDSKSESQVGRAFIIGGVSPIQDFLDDSLKPGLRFEFLYEYYFFLENKMGLGVKVGFTYFGISDDYRISDDFEYLRGEEVDPGELDVTFGLIHRFRNQGITPYLSFYPGVYSIFMDKKEGDFRYGISSTDFGFNVDLGIAIPLKKPDKQPEYINPFTLKIGAAYNYVYTPINNTSFVFIYIGF